MRVSPTVVQELRQRQNDICLECDQPMLPGEPTDVDHRVSRARGGQDHLDNFQLTHSACNRKKGKGKKGGAIRPVTKRFTRSDIKGISERIAEDEGVAEAEVARRFHEWALGIGLRVRPAGTSATGGLYYDRELSDRTVTIFSVWGKGTIQLHLQDMRILPSFVESDELLSFATSLVGRVPNLTGHNGFANLHVSITK